MIYRIDRGVAIPKNKLRQNPWNPNRMTRRQQEAVQESINTYGQVTELLVRIHPSEKDCYEIIDGEHRFNVLPDVAYCNVIYGISDADAKKLSIVLNETKGSADKNDLAALLSELSIEFGDELITGLPWNENELNELLELVDDKWDYNHQSIRGNQTQEATKEFGYSKEEMPQSSSREIDTDSIELAHKCPRCGFEFDD